MTSPTGSPGTGAGTASSTTAAVTPIARVVRGITVGTAVVLAVAVAAGLGFVTGDVVDHPDRLVGLLVVLVVLAGYVVAGFAVTARGPAVLEDRLLRRAVSAAVAAAVVGTLAVVLVPPISASSLPALALLLAAGGITAWVSRRGVGRDADADPPEAVHAGLHAGPHAGLLVGLLTVVLGAELLSALVIAGAPFVPEALLPDLAPFAAGRADGSAQSRIDLVDRYLWLLLFGALAGLLLTVLCRSAADPRHGGARTGRGTGPR